MTSTRRKVIFAVYNTWGGIAKVSDCRIPKTVAPAPPFPSIDFCWHLLWVSKPEGVLPYSLFAEANVMYIPWDPSLVPHLLTSSQPARPPVTSLHASAEVGVGLGWNEKSPTKTAINPEDVYIDDICPPFWFGSHAIVGPELVKSDKWKLMITPQNNLVFVYILQFRCCSNKGLVWVCLYQLRTDGRTL